MKQLIEAFSSLVNRIRGAAYLDDQAIKGILLELQRALLRADVPLDAIKLISDSVSRKLREERPPPGISTRDYAMYVIYQELVRLMGSEPRQWRPPKPSVVMLVGIEGSGKTTTAAKLARFLRNRGYRVGLVAADLHRPGAVAQLRQLANKVGVEFYGVEGATNAVEVAKKGVELLLGRVDVVIVDTAGRHRNEEELMRELASIYEELRPNEVLLVIDAMYGKQASQHIEAFSRTVPITGIIVSKLDSTAKGGGALIAAIKTGRPVLFIGTGEDIDELEQFDPHRFVARLLGMGDLQALVERVRSAIYEEELVREIESGKLTLLTLKKQLEALMRMGPLSKIVQLIPGFVNLKLSEDQIELSERNMRKWYAILCSMTREELENPDIINSSRIRRIALGAGVSPSDVKELLNVYNTLRRMSRALRRQRRLLLR